MVLLQTVSTQLLLSAIRCLISPVGPFCPLLLFSGCPVVSSPFASSCSCPDRGSPHPHPGLRFGSFASPQVAGAPAHSWDLAVGPTDSLWAWALGAHQGTCLAQTRLARTRPCPLAESRLFPRQVPTEVNGRSPPRGRVDLGSSFGSSERSGVFEKISVKETAWAQREIWENPDPMAKVRGADRSPKAEGCSG